MKNLKSNMSSKRPFIPHINATSCEQITKSSGSNFFKSFHLLPKDKMEALTVFYAYCRIVDDCVDEPTQTKEKQIALDFWRNEIVSLYQDKPQHIITEELAKVVRHYNIPENYLLGIADGCQMDINKSHYETYDDLMTYCYHVAGLVGLSCLKIFDYQSPQAEKMAIDLGLAFQLTNIMRDIKEDITRNRLYIPQEDLNKFNCSMHDLKKLKETDAFKRLMRDYYNRAEKHYLSAFEEFKNDKDNKLVAAKFMAKTYYKILNKLKKQDYPVLRNKVSLNFFEKLSLLIPVLLKK
ncbi:MAG: phytoene/squalene synthase family protein [bacterium]